MNYKAFLQDKRKVQEVVAWIVYQGKRTKVFWMKEDRNKFRL